MSDNITEIRVEDLHDSPFNPRETFHEADDIEMVADIKAHGRILQPLLVRPRIGPLFGNDLEAAAGFEVIFGHRRKRNGTAAGLLTMPCMIRAMDDAEARRIQISENLSRKDVHPMEEAKGFQALIENDGETADTIAEKFGKSRSYVYGRLKLLEACPEIRKACLAGEIGSEVALLVARLRTPKLQEKALAAIRSNYIDMHDGGAKSYRHIRELLVEKFTLNLKKAMFDIEDEMLLPLAGHCVRCTKRSGNAPEFADVADDRKSRHNNVVRGDADACTDPDCFEAKTKAHLQREAKKLEAEGKVVITGGAARTAISARGDIKGAYIALKDVQAELKKATKQFTLAGHPIAPVVLIQDPRTGKAHKAVKREDVKAAGIRVTAAPQSNEANYAAQRASAEAASLKRREAHEAQQAINDKLLDRTLLAMQSQPRTTQELYWMAEIVFDATEWEVRKKLAKRHGFDKPDQLEKVLGQWPGERLAMFAIECVLSHDAYVDEYRHYPNGGAHAKLFSAAKHYGVNLSEVIAEGASTPSIAARAAKNAVSSKKSTKAAPAAELGKAAAPRGKSKEKALRADQKDDAGVAGGSVQADLLEGAAA